MKKLKIKDNDGNWIEIGPIKQLALSDKEQTIIEKIGLLRRVYELLNVISIQYVAKMDNKVNEKLLAQLMRQYIAIIESEDNEANQQSEY